MAVIIDDEVQSRDATDVVLEDVVQMAVVMGVGVDGEWRCVVEEDVGRAGERCVTSWSEHRLS